MIPMPAALAAHLTETVTTLCHCWTLTRRDGAVSGYTDHDRPLELDGVTHRPDTGFTPASAESALGLAIALDGIEGALASDDISAQDLAESLYDGAEVAVWLVNWQDTAQKASLRRAGIARVECADGIWRAEIEDLTAGLSTPRGRHVRRGCDAELGDSRCGVDTQNAAWRGTGVVSAVQADGTLTVTGLGAFTQGWFDHGRLSWTSGALAGRAAGISAHRVTAAGATLHLRGGPVPSVGDAFVAVAGCDRSFAMCKAKFSNGLNFRGFPHVPGTDAGYAYASQAMLFDGGVVVP